MAANNHAGVGPRAPQVVVLVGATGDLSRRKLLPGLFHLASAGFMPGCRIIGVSLDDIDADGFRQFARKALDEFSTRKSTEPDWSAFAACLDYVPLGAGAEALRAAVDKAEKALGAGSHRLHYLSVPPSAALAAVQPAAARRGLVERSRVVMEKPFGTDLASAMTLNAQAARGVRARTRSSASTTSSARSRRRTSSRSASRNGLFEPIWNRNFIDHVQIDVPETLGLGKRIGVLRVRSARSATWS